HRQQLARDILTVTQSAAQAEPGTPTRGLQQGQGVGRSGSQDWRSSSDETAWPKAGSDAMQAERWTGLWQQGSWSVREPTRPGTAAGILRGFPLAV
ncbi:unnamed protein product, partial [Prorocentrum cordatum]